MMIRAEVKVNMKEKKKERESVKNRTFAIIQ